MTISNGEGRSGAVGDGGEGGAGVREDGRTEAQIRALSSELRVLSRADGSCRYGQGETALTVAVYGPTEVRYRDERLDRATIEVVFKPASGVPGPQEREYEAILRTAMEQAIISTLHPRTLIQIVVQVMNDDGSLLSAAINATCLALLDAGIPMRSLIAGVDLAIVASTTTTTTVLLDPTKEEETREGAVSLSFGFASGRSGESDVASSSSGGVVWRTKGLLREEEFMSCSSAARKATQKLFSYFQLSLSRRSSLLS